MNNPNPFLPQATLEEKQKQNRSRLKVAVTCVLAVSVVSLVTMLGCKREEPPTIDNSNPDNGGSTAATNNPVSSPDTNVVTGGMPPAPNSGGPGQPPTGQGQLPPPPGQPGQPGQPTGGGLPPIQPQNQYPGPQGQSGQPPLPPTGGTLDQGAPGAGSEYHVVKGDTLGKIAKKSSVTVKALEAANPGVDSKHLKIGQKIVIPAGGKSPDASAVPGTGGATGTAGADTSAEAGFVTYTVKSHDTLGKIAKKNGTSVKAIQAANHLTTTAIKVGQKLKIPSKGGATTPTTGAESTTVPPPPTPTPAAPVNTVPPGGAIPGPSTAPAGAPTGGQGA